MANNLSKAYIRIDNNGVYIMQFYVIYTTASGKTTTLFSNLMGYRDKKRLEYPDDSVKVQLLVQVEVLPDIFKTFFNKTYTITGKRCFVTSGASLTPSITEVFCPQYDDSYVSVDCAGFYYMWLYVIYTLPSGETTTMISPTMGVGDSFTIYYPPDITSVRVIVQIAKFIGVYSNIYDVTFTSADRICLEATGTVFSAGVKRFPCHV